MRDLRLELSGLALVALVAGAVWLTRHPDAPSVRRAERWPLVGPAARSFRERWAPPAPPPPPPAAPPVVEVHYVLESDGPSPGRGAPGRGAAPAGGQERVDVRAVAASGPRSAGGSGLAAVLPVPARAAEPRLVARAVALFERAPEEHRLAGYRLLTDAADRARIERWRTIAAASEAAWRARYGVEPLGAPAETVVLFARVGSLHELARSEPRLGALDAAGFAVDGLVALAVEGLVEAELQASFQHELAHLLTRRSIGPALPSWLAEGLAEEFGQAKWREEAFDFASIGGSVARDGDRFELRGGYAALDRLARRVAAGEVPSLAALAAVSESDFSAGEAGLDRYGASFAWVRFLLAEPARAGRFRAFLAAVARGEEPGVAQLEVGLGAPLAALETPFAAWVEAEADRLLRAAGVPRGPLLRAPRPLREVPPSEIPPLRSERDNSGTRLSVSSLRSRERLGLIAPEPRAAPPRARRRCRRRSARASRSAPRA